MALPSNKRPARVVIYATDIEMLTGFSKRSVYRLMRNIRVAFNKGPKTLVTVEEFCAYTGISEELVKERIGS